MKKRSLFIYFLFAVSLMMSSCIKQVEKKYSGKTVVEIDASVLNSNAVDVTYPISTRILPDGRPLSTTVDSTFRRLSGTVKIRLNLVGPQSSKNETVGYKLFNSPVTTIAFPATLLFNSGSNTAGRQQPAQPAATLSVQDAIAGTHYTALTGMATIPADSSFGYINIQVLNPGPIAGQARFIGIQLDSTGSLLPSPNYLRIGLIMDQR